MMTKEEIYQEYVKWHRSGPALSQEELFHNPAGNIDLTEDEETLVNCLCYLVLEGYGGDVRYFLFCEENIFAKMPDGELHLTETSYRILN